MTNPFAYRVGDWLPRDQQILDNWLITKIKEVTDNPPVQLHPVIQELKDLIENDVEIYIFFHQMFDDVPPSYNLIPNNKSIVPNYIVMLHLFNVIMSRAPEFNDTGLVACPINAVLDWPMGTGSGFAAFLNKKVNEKFRNMLDYWAIFLKSPKSRYVLTDDPKYGWFSEAASKAMPDFDENYVCAPTEPYHGFTSWDDFFVRLFRPGKRPVEHKDDPAYINNACEAAPYAIARGVKERDIFWIKSQPYSLQDMLGKHPYTSQFIGGTVYQGFLSALNYHRWHSPVAGTVKEILLVEGTYYSETPAVTQDPSPRNASQGYMSEVATRGMIFIEADNPAIGLMCFLAIGMVEVSTIDITVGVDQHLEKGDEIGMFHFGGSSHCLIFRPGVDLTFYLNGQTPGVDAQNLNVKSVLASVNPAPPPLLDVTNGSAGLIQQILG